MKDITTAWKNNDSNALQEALTHTQPKDCGKIIALLEKKLNQCIESGNTQLFQIAVDWVQRNHSAHQGRWCQFCKEVIVGKYLDVDEMTYPYLDICASLSYQKYYPSLAIALIEKIELWEHFTKKVLDRLNSDDRKRYLFNSLMHCPEENISLFEKFLGISEIETIMKNKQGYDFWTGNDPILLHFKNNTDKQMEFLLKYSEQKGFPIEKYHRSLPDFINANWPNTMSYLIDTIGSDVIEKEILPLIQKDIDKSKNSALWGKDQAQRLQMDYDLCKKMLLFKKIDGQIKLESTPASTVKI